MAALAVALEKSLAMFSDPAPGSFSSPPPAFFLPPLGFPSAARQPHWHVDMSCIATGDVWQRLVGCLCKPVGSSSSTSGVLAPDAPAGADATVQALPSAH
jgi:hypothetical protein